MAHSDIRVRIWEATKARYATMTPCDSKVIDTLDEARYKSIQQGPKPHLPRLTWHQADCVDVAIAMKSRGLKPLLLNMASDFQPGGGVWKGASAQEEELFRRSNYHKFLHRRWYPFPPLRTILSRSVEFYRASSFNDYALLPEPVTLDCVAVAGIRRPERTADQRLFKHPQDADLLKQKLRILIQAALDNGNDALVLSALGCGAFRGPVYHIARVFREVLEETRGCFREITFAILGDNFIHFKQSFQA